MRQVAAVKGRPGTGWMSASSQVLLKVTVPLQLSVWVHGLNGLLPVQSLGKPAWTEPALAGGRTGHLQRRALRARRLAGAAEAIEPGRFPTEFAFALLGVGAALRVADPGLAA